jgi:hypothetical protein
MQVIFVVIGYETKTDQGQLLDSCQIEVYAKNADEAIKKAEKYIKKSFYLVKQIIEKNDTT